MKTINTAELEELILNRGSTYGLLARIYRAEVEPELLEQMTRMDFSIDVDQPEISEGYRLLSCFLEQRTENTLTDLAVDYARIFLGAGLGQGEGAYPYESVYTGPDRLVMQDARDQVLKLYREVGLARAEDEFQEPEDHVALELEVMAYLCQKTTEALKDGNESRALGYLKKQKDLLQEHLMPWVPRFCGDVQRLAQGDFYRAVAKITIGYLSMERDLIGELMDEIQEKNGEEAREHAK